MLAVSMTPPIATIPAYMSGTSDHKSDSPASSSTNKRPKLSLQTNALSNAFGGISRGRSSNAPISAATTPTTTNTYSNTWDLTFRPSPVSRTSSPRPFGVNRSVSPHQPYDVVLPFGVKSILKNSPLPPDARRGSVTLSPRESRRKVLFPPAKKVTFKRHLEDVIENVKYVAKHSDLNSSSDSDISISDNSQDSPDEIVEPESAHLSSPPPAKRRRRRRNSNSQQDSGSPPENEAAEDRNAINVTPRADRKRRKWEWTLAPIQKNEPIETAAPYSAETGTVQEELKVDKSADEGPTNTERYPISRFGEKPNDKPRGPEKKDISSPPASVEITSDLVKNSRGNSGNLKEDEQHGNEPPTRTGSR